MSNSAEATRTVVLEKVFPHPPERLWRALTDRTLIAQWLLKNDFEPSVGHEFQFRSEPVPNWDGVIECEVLMVEPLRQLSYTWKSMGLESVVLFTMTSAEGGTRLRVEQSGFRPEHEAAFKGATYGWQMFLGKLEGVLGGMTEEGSLRA